VRDAKVQRFEDLERQADAELGVIGKMAPSTAAFYAEEVLGAADCSVYVARLAREAERVYISHDEAVPSHVIAAAAVLKPLLVDPRRTRSAQPTKGAAKIGPTFARFFQNRAVFVERILFTCLTLVLFTLLASHIANTVAGYKLEALRAETERLAAQRRVLELKQAELLSPDRLEKLAREHFNWRYDSGLVAGPVPCAGGNCANGPDGTDSLVDVSGITPDQQFQNKGHDKVAIVDK